MTRLSTFAILSLVALRLLTGWHFYNEGVKKLDPDFSSAGFLRAAKGPLAPLYHSMVKGPYDAYECLSAPHELGTADEAPEAEWLGRIEAGWNEAYERATGAGVGGETADRLAALRDAGLESIKNYLSGDDKGNPGESEAIGELQHEAWRLAQLKEEAGDNPAPFQQILIDDKQREVWAGMQPWVRTYQQIEADYLEQATALYAEAGLIPSRAEGALAERTMLSRIDWLVTWTVLLCGVCLFLGFATRIAAVVAACFLLSLMSMQPPWAGVEMKEFFFWAIEIAALLVIAALGAGRWAGIDGLIDYFRSGSQAAS